MISIERIAFQLSYINRFNGKYGAYSLAQHACYLSEMVDDHKLGALLMCAPSVETGTDPELNADRDSRAWTETARRAEMYRHFGVSNLFNGRYGPVTNILEFSYDHLTAMEVSHFDPDAEAVESPFEITTWHPDHARFMFLERYRELTK